MDTTSMFLIRAAFGLAVIVMLLPADEAQQAKVTGQAGNVVERAALPAERVTPAALHRGACCSVR